MEYGYIVKYYSKKKPIGKRINTNFKEALQVARKEIILDKKALGFKIFNENKQEIHLEARNI